jgi:hypothetical protein
MIIFTDNSTIPEKALENIPHRTVGTDRTDLANMASCANDNRSKLVG